MAEAFSIGDCAQGGTRTPKDKLQRLLRPQRLPISPPGQFSIL